MGLVIHAQTINLTLNGLFSERQEMSAFPRLADTDDSSAASPLSQAVNFDSQFERQVLAWLKSKTTTPTPDLIPDQRAELPALDTRTGSPGVYQIVKLRQVYDDLYNKAKDDKTESSWSGYRTLIRYWERFHNGDGPCVTSISKDSLQQFFEAVPEWYSERSWQRNRDLMFALLKSICPETSDNAYGRPKADALLLRDDLPVWNLPTERWFRDRPKPVIKSSKQKRGGHRRRKIPLLKVDEFGAVLKACRDATFMHSLFWETWLSLLWYNGHRFEDSLAYKWDEGRLHFDLENRLLDFTETKCGGESAVPMPDFLFNLLTELRAAQGNPCSGEPVFALAKGERFPHDAEPDFRLPRGDITNRARRLDVEYRAIWQRAGVPIRHPHEMRAASITYWTQHAPEYRFAVTGHKPPRGDTQLRSYVILDEKFYQAAEAFPYPAT